MAKMKTLTLNGETYTVDDPDSVSYEEEQNLSDDEKAKARGNIAAASVEDLEAFRKVAASSAIVCEASGEVIAVSDASNLQLQGLTLYGKPTQNTTTGKNLIPFKYSSGGVGTWTNLGITTTVTPDGGITLSGTATGAFYFWLCQSFTAENLPAGTYYLSVAGMHDMSVQIEARKDGAYVSTIRWGAGAFTVDYSTYDTIRVFLFCNSGKTVNETIYPQIEVGSTPTAYEPYTGGKASPNPDYPQDLVSVGNDGNIGVTVVGKNLYKGDYYGGYVQTPIPDNGLFLGSSTSPYCLYVEVKQGITYTITMPKTATSTSKSRIGFTAIHPKKLVNGVSPCYEYQVLSVGVNTATATAPIDGWMVVMAYSSADNVPIETQINQFQVEVGTNSTEYEPYKEPQTLTVQTPNGLPGNPLGKTIPDTIKASEALMAGVWWDEETQQYYISDTIDFAKGAYVQRISPLKKITFTDKVDTGNANVKRFNSWTTSAAKLYVRGVSSTHFKGSAWLWNNLLTGAEEKVCVNPTANLVSVFTASMANYTVTEFNDFISANNVMFQYVLATPVETPLSAEELAQYAALHTNKPNTTIFNDSGAEMKVEYVADSKSYIDNKFAQLAAQIVNNT